jgi:hypothetical protein
MIPAQQMAAWDVYAKDNPCIIMTGDDKAE